MLNQVAIVSLSDAHKALIVNGVKINIFNSYPDESYTELVGAPSVKLSKALGVPVTKIDATHLDPNGDATWDDVNHESLPELAKGDSGKKAELLKLAEEKGVEPSDLDDLVGDMGDNLVTRANNDGIEAQIEFLEFACGGYEVVEAELNEITKRPK